MSNGNAIHFPEQTRQVGLRNHLSPISNSATLNIVPFSPAKANSRIDEVIPSYSMKQGSSEANSDRLGKLMDITREELDAKLATNLARLENLEIRIESKIATGISKVEAMIDAGFAEQRAINSRIETTLAHKPTTLSMMTTVGSGAVGALVLLLTVLAFAGDRFDAGISLVGSSVHEIEQLQQRQAGIEKALSSSETRTNQQFNDLSSKLDLLLKDASSQ